MSARAVTADDLRRLADALGDRTCDAVSITTHPDRVSVRVRLLSSPAGEWGFGRNGAEAVNDFAQRVRLPGAPSRCRVCLCVCTDEEHALTEEQARALKLDAATAVVCLDCLRKHAPPPAPRVVQTGTVACDLADRYPAAVRS